MSGRFSLDAQVQFAYSVSVFGILNSLNCRQDRNPVSYVWVIIKHSFGVVFGYLNLPISHVK